MAEAACVLHARVGRTARRPTPARDEPAGARNADGADGNAGGTCGALARAYRRIERVPAAIVLLGVLLLASWPHLAWMARRLTDGSDEPWGVLAVVTVLVLVAREWRRLALPARGALYAAAALAVSAAVARTIAPPIVAATIAMVSLATFLAAARRERPALPLATLLLLALPVIASLQFYFGYPLRVATAALAAPVLATFGFAAQAQGAALLYDGRTVLVDPPCAGIGMLWVGAYTAALLSYLGNAPALHALRNACVAAVSVFVANVARNVALFFPEALDLQWPAWTHPAIGLVAFAIALLPIGLVAAAPAPRHDRRPLRALAWPTRFHRRPA